MYLGFASGHHILDEGLVSNLFPIVLQIIFINAYNIRFYVRTVDEFYSGSRKTVALAVVVQNKNI